MIWVFVIVWVAFAALAAYTTSVQEATLYWGKVLAGGDQGFGPTGMQDAITPPGQNLRNVAQTVGFVGIPVAGIYFLGWLAGIAGFVGALILVGVLKVVMPAPESRYFVNVLIQGVADRAAEYRKASDPARASAAEEMTEMLTAAFVANQTHADSEG